MRQTNTNGLNGIRTHVLSEQEIKTYALDRAATGTGFSFEDGGEIFIRNAGNHLQDYTESQSRNPQLSPLW
jgi:hypothetical protein